MTSQAPPWWRHRSATKARPRESVTLEAIVSAAMALIESGDLEMLTMRKLAAELGVSTSSVYWWAGNKEELLTLMVDVVLGRVDVANAPRRTSWMRSTRDVALSSYHVLSANRALVPVILRGVPAGPNALRIADRQISILLAGGFTEDDAISAHLAIASLTLGSVPGQDRGIVKAGTDDESQGGSAWRWVNLVGRNAAPLPVESHPGLVAIAEALQNGTPEERFLFALDALLQGLDLSLAKRQHVQSP